MSVVFDLESAGSQSKELRGLEEIAIRQVNAHPQIARLRSDTLANNVVVFHDRAVDEGKMDGCNVVISDHAASVSPRKRSSRSRTSPAIRCSAFQSKKSAVSSRSPASQRRKNSSEDMPCRCSNSSSGTLQIAQRCLAPGSLARYHSQQTCVCDLVTKAAFVEMLQVLQDNQRVRGHGSLSSSQRTLLTAQGAQLCEPICASRVVGVCRSEARVSMEIVSWAGRSGKWPWQLEHAFRRFIPPCWHELIRVHVAAHTDLVAPLGKG